MKVKFYHRFYTLGDLSVSPRHFFYAATELEKYGIDVSYCGDSSLANRLYRGVKIALNLIFSSEPYDVLYGSTANGLEVLVLLRSLRIFNKPIVVWQHRAIKRSDNPLVKIFLRFYYRGFDQMFLFSSKHVDESLSTGLMPSSKLLFIKWGADLEYYDRIMDANKYAANHQEEPYFCSTGRENRDFPTLIDAFQKAGRFLLRIYTTRRHGKMNNEETLLTREAVSPNIRIGIIDGRSVNNAFLTKEIHQCYCAVICCNEHNYTVGLTSLHEAMALGKAVIISRNPYFPIDVEKENIGIKVDYGDVEGWASAIKYLSERRSVVDEMGKNARQLAEKEYNLDMFSVTIAEVLKNIGNKSASRIPVIVE